MTGSVDAQIELTSDVAPEALNWLEDEEFSHAEVVYYFHGCRGGH